MQDITTGNQGSQGNLRAVTLLALLAAGLVILPLQDAKAGPQAPTLAQQKCVNALNKELFKLDGAATKQVSGCLKSHIAGKALDKGDPAVTTLEQCVQGDRVGKIAKSRSKATDIFGRKCGAPLPPFGASDATDVADAGVAQSRALVRDVFGPDLDDPGSLLTREDDRAGSKCQSSVWKALLKCKKVKLKQFLGCKKAALKTETVTSADDLTLQCLMGEGDPASGQPDPKGKIAKACTSEKGIPKALTGACDALDLNALFPGCSGSGDTGKCLDAQVECRLCLAVNTADGLERNCDAFDNGADDGSCGCGDGMLTDAEECDDGNTVDDDSCANDCTATTAASCYDVLASNPSAPDGNYLIALPDGDVLMHCDMTSAGGGWTRVGILDGMEDYCTETPAADLRVDPDASAGKVPDSDVHALLNQTVGSPNDVMFYVTGDGRFLWHALENVSDFDTASRHTSSGFYCTNWQCHDGTIDATTCGSEGGGCPVTGHGTSGVSKKVYVDFSAARHIHGMHINGSLCGLPNFERAPIWVYVR